MSGGMHVAGLWRYPVKSLGGEPLVRARLTSDGVDGDRRVHVSRGDAPLTGRTRPELLTIPASTSDDGTPLIAGHPWTSSVADALVRERAGPTAVLREFTGPERFDVTNLTVATDGSVARFGHGVRRLRPNLLLAGVPAGEELGWPGSALRIGDAVVGVHSVRQRCVVTSIDPDTGQQDLDVFRRIRTEFDNRLALDCWVITPGTVQVGDPVQLVPTAAVARHVGGWIVGAPYVRPR